MNDLCLIVIFMGSYYLLSQDFFFKVVLMGETFRSCNFFGWLLNCWFVCDCINWCLITNCITLFLSNIFKFSLSARNSFFFYFQRNILIIFLSLNRVLNLTRMRNARRISNYFLKHHCSLLSSQWSPAMFRSHWDHGISDFNILILRVKGTIWCWWKTDQSFRRHTMNWESWSTLFRQIKLAN